MKITNKYKEPENLRRENILRERIETYVKRTDAKN